MNLPFLPALARHHTPSAGEYPDSVHPAALLTLRLAAILIPLLRLINAAAAILGAIHLPLHARIARAHLRLTRLLARLAEGKSWHPRTAKPGTKGGPHGPYISRAQSWLVARLGHHAAGYGAQLQFLLNEPATRALLAAAPPAAQASAARTLRPLARLLGITLPDILQPPPNPPRPKPAKPPRPAKPAPQPHRHPIYPQRRPRFILYPTPPKPASREKPP